MTIKPAIHFVGFRGDEYLSAIRVWGQPDFIHQWWDRRAAREIAVEDTVIFTQKASMEIGEYNAPDPDGGPREFERKQR